MSYQYPEIKNFLGLYSQANSFTVPDGAMEDADNIVISRDGVASKRRGTYQYYDPSSDTLNSLHNYQNKLLAVFSDKVAYFTDTGTTPSYTGTRTTLTGVTVAVTGTRRSVSAQSNKNFYFTTDNGVMKLEAYNSSVYQSGVSPALDLKARFLPLNGPIAATTQVAWRVLFGRRDANDNLLLGSPSDIVTLTNSTYTGATWVRNSNVVTVTYAGHNLSTGMQIVVSNSAGGAPDVVAGTYTVTVTSSSVFTFAETAANDASGNTLDFTSTRTTRIEGSIPSEISSTTDAYFVQVYRSDQTGSVSISPSADFKLVYERKLTSAEITAKHFYFDDDFDDILLESELYTNPNSREGELQANDRAPLCDDITLYKNHLIHANCETRHLLDLQVVDPASAVATDYFEVKVDATTRRYVAREGVANQTVAATSVANNGSGKIQITYASHGLANNDTIYIANVVAGSLAAGTYYIINKTANTFEISTSSGGSAVAFNSETGLDFQGVTNGTYPIFLLDITSSSASVKLRATAQGLVKAINRDSSSLVYARYVSGLDETPGKIRLTAKGFTGAIYMRASGATAGEVFSPILPASFASGDQVYSRNDNQPNALYISKLGIPEAVPLTNFIPVGASNKEILRVVALRDSVIILKEDGVFRLNGDGIASFSITPLDTTVICVAANSVCLLNNQVLALTNQGVVLISDSSVQIISRKIEDVISAILGVSTLSAQTGAVSYESDRLYLLTTLEPQGTTAGITYSYNILNDTWTSSTELSTNGVIGPNDQLYTISTGNKLKKERKNQTRIDFCGQNYSITVVSVSADLLSAVINVSTAPASGDSIVKSDVFNRIYSVTSLGSSNYTVLFESETNLVAADTAILYKGYTSTIKMAPFHAGLVGRSKQFAQLQIHLRDESISRAVVSFSGSTFGGSEPVTWRSSAISGVSEEGWGELPWGIGPWGATDSITNQYGTQPASIIRLYVPRFQQRNTFIQTTIEHSSAGEALNIQALSFSVRPYGERVSR